MSHTSHCILVWDIKGKHDGCVDVAEIMETVVLDSVLFEAELL